MKRILFIFLLFNFACLSAQEVQDSVKIYFRQGKYNLDMSVRENRNSLDRIADSMKTSYADSILRIKKILAIGGASPEGSVNLNKRLSKKRADVLFNYLSQYGELPDSLKSTEFIGRDWNGLIRLAEADPNVPYKDETLELLNEIADEVRNNVSTNGDHLQRIKKLRYGVPYYYMYQHLFPELRASQLFLWYEKVRNPRAPMKLAGLSTSIADLRTPFDIPEMSAPSYIPESKPSSPFYMGIKTNMLYDALAVPNLGVEFYLGKNWTVVGNWMYGWWKTDRKHRYWRIYGGDLAVRKWFGKEADRKSLTGHHLGIYGQVLTYDFEWGGRGYMAGVPGGNIFDRANYAFGVEYGYSLPIARRFNIDFTLGVGYMGGQYYEYIPEDDCYVWQATKQRHWFGPTKLEISLVWLIGSGNYNWWKGGKR